MPARRARVPRQGARALRRVTSRRLGTFARFDTAGMIAPEARAVEDSRARVGEESPSTSASVRILSSPSSASESVETMADDVDARPSTSGSRPVGVVDETR